MTNMDAAELGPPSITLAHFRLWIHGRQFPDAQDEWDGNWLHVTAACETQLARVFATGPIILVTDLVQCRRQVDDMMQGKAKEACLEPLEPELSLHIRATDTLGHMALQVAITPDHLTQKHCFQFEIDQSYLPTLSSQLATAERDYPPRGQR